MERGPQSDEMLDGGVPVAQAIRDLDVGDGSLGPRDAWPDSLRTAADICLMSRFPMLVMWGPDLEMIYNDAYVPLIGRKHPTAMGRPASQVLAEAWDIIGPLTQQVLEGGEATWSEDQPITLDRRGFLEEGYFTFSYSPIREEDGRVGGIFIAVTETTGQVLVDRRLRTLGLLADHTRDAESVREAGQGAIRALASAREEVPFAHLYETSGDDARLIATTDPAVAPPEHVDLDADPWRFDQVLRDREPRLIELHPGSEQHGRADPDPTPVVHAMALPLKDVGSNEPLGVALLGVSPSRPLDDEYRRFLALIAEQTARGIVDARAAEVERDRLTGLAELNRAKTEFFSNVSHEFRTPLTLLHGPLLEALADDEHPLPEEQHRRLTMAQRNAERLGKLVNTLLDFSRLEAGRISASYRATDLSELTRELASVFPSAVERAGLRYEVEAQDLPQSVYLDREMWEKIVFNLLSNAIKFTLDGAISVRLRDGGDHALFEVADTGVGISQEEIPHLFERFHRVRRPNARSQEGTGIGLSLVRELVDLHGGRVEVDSEVDHGSCFTIVIPYGASHLPQDQIDAGPALESTSVAASAYIDDEDGDQLTPEELHEAARRSEVGGTGGASILVVDDNADMRTYLTRLLEVHWEVRTAANGDIALRMAREDRPDLILSDVMMPGLDGFELLEALRGDASLQDVPFVLLSARASEASQVEGLDGGADDYLVKPFTIAELIARIRTNLRLAQQRAHTADVRARHAMLAGLSHEMQTPLAAILGSLAVLDHGDLPGDTQPVMDIMRRQARQLKGLVQQFLDFSRLEADRDPVLHLASLDPIELVERSVEVCGNPLVEVRIPDGPLDHVRADADRVEQIITNLCTNALKFSENGDPVDVSASPGADDTVVIRVRDRGVGIAPDEADLVFDKFYRGRAGDRADGTGLGLYVSRALAEAMGGTLTLEADAGPPGASFALTLPTA